MKRWSLLVLVLLAAAALFVKSKERDRSNNPVQAGQFLRLNLEREPATLDPRKGGDVVSTSLHFMLFNGLARVGADGKTQLSGADSYTLSTDKLTYTFYLKEATWSNGLPVTAHDYEYSWKKIADPIFPAPNAHLIYPIKNARACKEGKLPISELGVKALSDRTLVVTLERPCPYLLDLLSFCIFFPISKENELIYSDWAYNKGDRFVCNGPFLLKEWKHQNEILLVKNPHYLESTLIKLSGIHMSMVASENTALQMYEKGELDLLTTSASHLPIDSIERLKQRGYLHIHPSAASTFCTFNTSKKPFSNINIRKAFGYAINRQELVDNITQLGEPIATGPIPPLLKNGRNRLFFRDGDKAAAKAYLAKGLEELAIKKEELNSLTYTYSISESNDKIAQAIQQQWKETLGVTVNLCSTEHKTLLDKLGKRNYDFAQAIWVAQYPDQVNILERFALKDNVKNYAGWEDLSYMRLLNRSNNEFDSEERALTLEEAEERFVEMMPVTLLFHMNYAFLIQPYVRDVSFTPMGFVLIEHLSINKEEKARQK